MSLPEPRSKRFSFAVQDSIGQLLQQSARPSISEYINNLIAEDLIARGLLTREQLQTIMQGDVDGDDA